jgi:hypothetical protein
MRWPLRCLFAILMVLVFASQVVRANRGLETADPLPKLMAALERLHVRIIESSDNRIFSVSSPLCEQPFLVALMPIHGGNDDMIRQIQGPEVVIRFVYGGQVFDHPRWYGFIGEWARTMVSFQLGSRRAMPSPRFVVVAMPRSCARLTNVDWAALSD